MKRKLLNGNQAAALAVKLARAQVVCAYPITPQTSLVESIAEMCARGDFPGEYINVEAEYSALAYLIGASYAGARTFTATSSQGLAYMHELLHWAAGARLPIVMVNANRALGAPWSLEPDQLDSLAQRDTGWLQFYCADVQEILDTVILSFRLTEETGIPCMVIYDGFVLSHTYEVVELPEQTQADAFLPAPPDKAALRTDQPQNIQAVTDFRYLSRVLQQRHRDMLQVPGLVQTLMQEYTDIFGRSYPLVEAYQWEEAGTVIVAAGSAAQTVKSVLPSLADRDGKKGLLRIRLFRPLPGEEITSLLARPQIKKIVVIDRDLSTGTGGVFAQELRALLQGSSCQGKIYELNLAGGVDFTPNLLRRGLEALARSDGDGRGEIIWGVDL
ncbi:Pyruvate:ferredoxin oxidoreductase and related 2-oxoacid:ferredoxin oxidoreductases, alpha subunit [anaerobic digester metagenome]|uniref:Pyruvate:ferredoxin oxidoreductase and related 2-oxoacid:ferredoxin oxidoreductases, alpha subunit n=1 Tax=anaerobic digester metagenome TaxID=1263854 RepID=A0A485M5H3_9ZZZZ